MTCLGTASELHQHTVDRAQRRFERQLANSERELKSAMKQRRDNSSSVAEKRQATQHLEHLRTTLNNDYSQLIQVNYEVLFLSICFALYNFT